MTDLSIFVELNLVTKNDSQYIVKLTVNRVLLTKRKIFYLGEGQDKSLCNYNINMPFKQTFKMQVVGH